MNILPRLQELVNELNTTNSKNDKMKILAKYSDLQSILSIIYSGFSQFGVTSKNILKLWNRLENDTSASVLNTNLYDLLNSLSNREYTGHFAIKNVIDFINNNLEYKELILNAIDKNLKCRIDSKIINTVFSDCVPVYDVALAKDIDKLPASAKPDFGKDAWYASRKMDGLRINCNLADDITLLSRTGKEFLTLSKLKDELKKLNVKDIVLDGECCIINGELEDFHAISKEYNMKGHTIQNPKLLIFDCLTKEEFESRTSKRILNERYEQLNNLIKNYNGDSLEVIEQILIRDYGHLEELKTMAAEKGWEGLILRKDTVYKGKRSNDLVKVKAFKEEEFIVKSIETGMMRVIDSVTGLEVEIETLTRVNIEYKGNIVGVGSGFSIDERKEFYNDPGKIIGKQITVKYFSESINEQGGISLRFPTVKAIWTNGKRDA